MKCRIIIVELIKEDHATTSIQEIILSRHGINVLKHGIQKIIQKYNTEGLYENRKQSGRPPKLSKRSMRVIRRTCLQNIPMSLTKISNAFNVGRSVHIGRDTVGRILKKYGLRSHQPIFKPFITAKQWKKRMEWARSKVN